MSCYGCNQSVSQYGGITVVAFCFVVKHTNLCGCSPPSSSVCLGFIHPQEPVFVIRSPIHTAVWILPSCNNSPPPPLCVNLLEVVRGEISLICLWRVRNRKLIPPPLGNGKSSLRPPIPAVLKRWASRPVSPYSLDQFPA